MAFVELKVEGRVELVVVLGFVVDAVVEVEAVAVPMGRGGLNAGRGFLGKLEFARGGMLFVCMWAQRPSRTDAIESL